MAYWTAGGEKRGRGLLSQVSLSVPPTLISFYERYLAEANEHGVTNADMMWAPTRSPLLNIWQAADHQVHDAAKNDVRNLFRERGAPSQAICLPALFA